ncbi:MAG: hypothetical protein COA42_23865 [Alteromonadaceae bacterium]|nr:MAG: hypothetical protein COA42_23865 [Alteromonadaceae bacterium]
MNIIRIIASEKERFLKFAAVGASGTAINVALVWLGNAILFSRLGEPSQTQASYALAIIVSIFSNYIFNSMWTWSDRRGQGLKFFFQHLLKYYLTNALAAGLQFLIATTIIYSLSAMFYTGGLAVPVLWKMAGSVIGIGLAGGINFLVNHFWNFNISTSNNNNNEVNSGK